ncbi:gibberellin 2-beta-dioxygenase 7-like [Eucalyptus grandis]|uniref:gibberellin 2-beta-dioxygenase 7-like n=1 Tax=Eucalyptus grandis TaxID=71139 RepID=UPI00192E8648|nr:gibberellin 2-beta-dioxygenase 7-like [Eucalyptus grandis]
MTGSISDPPRLTNFPQLLPSCPSSSSSPIQNANTATPQERELPVIDLSWLSSECEAERQWCAEAIRRAATDWGFFRVVNHGIRSELLGEMRREQVKLFETPFETKAKSGLLNNSYCRDTPTATSLAQCSWPEAFHVPLSKIYDPSCHGQFSSLGGVMMDLAPSMSRLARTLAVVLAENLRHGGRSAFDEICHESMCFLRLNHYPACPLSPEMFGLVPHVESDFLTILYQDQVGGLQLLKDSRRVPVKPNCDALIVSIGNLLQAWSNDVYRSVAHKVAMDGEVERYSVAYSLCPSSDSQIGSCREPSVYRKFTFGEYSKQVQEDIKRTGHKVGLPHFRLTKRKRSSRSVVPNKNEWPVPRHEEEEKHYADISTDLVLYENPWKIRKKLTESDLGHLSRLLLPRGCVKTHVLRWMGEEMVGQVESKDGMEVVVRDADTGDEHRLVFRYWASSRSYLLNGDWNKLFAKGRGLKVGDEIGMYWDTVSCNFHFAVLRKSGEFEESDHAWPQSEILADSKSVPEYLRTVPSQCESQKSFSELNSRRTKRGGNINFSSSKTWTRFSNFSFRKLRSIDIFWVEKEFPLLKSSRLQDESDVLSLYVLILDHSELLLNL